MIGIEKQGQVVRMVNLTPKPQPPKPPSKRGSVTEFSRKSRRRLIDLFSRVDYTAQKVTFITLTFAGTPTSEYAKKCLKRFLQRVRRKYSTTSGVWRVEVQQRGSFHFHLLMFNLPFWRQSELQDTWTECTQEPRSIVDIRLIRSAKHAMYYVSKYIAKRDKPTKTPSLDNAPYQHATAENWQGRHWGWLNQECIPMAERFTAAIYDKDVAEYFWWFAAARISRPNMPRRKTHRVYSDDADVIWAWAVEHGGEIVADGGRLWLDNARASLAMRTKVSRFFAAAHENFSGQSKEFCHSA